MATKKFNLKAGFITIAKWSLIGITYVIVFWMALIIWALTLVFMNPLFLWILGFICPKWVITETKDWCEKFDDLGLDMYWDAVEGVFNYLPWYARKQYILVKGLGYSDPETQVRLFAKLSPEDQKAYVNKLDVKAWRYFWQHNPKLRLLLLEVMDPSAESFEEILYPLDMVTVQAYVQKHPTLRAELVVLLRNKLQDAIKEHPVQDGFTGETTFLSNLLAQQIELNGGYEVLEGLGAMSPYVFDLVLKAMDVYKERNLVMTATNDQWREYCKYLNNAQKEMGLKAQTLMSIEQYRIYAEVGLVLSDPAVIYFIKKDSGRADGMAAEIFKRQTIEMSPKMEACLYANPNVYKLYVHAVVDKQPA